MNFWEGLGKQFKIFERKQTHLIEPDVQRWEMLLFPHYDT